MDTTQTLIAVAFSAFIAGTAGFLIYLQRKIKLQEKKRLDENNKMRLQVYERLALLVDRISLPSVVSRVNVPGLTFRDMQLIINQTIKEEFEYNITQQIYVSKEAWDAVKGMKDKNMLIVNQLAQVMPEGSTGQDFIRLLLEYLMNDPAGKIQDVVSEFLSFEAKKLLEE